MEGRTSPVLLILGALSLLLYGAIAWLSFDFHYGTGHADRPILAVLGLFAAATLCYLGALGWLPRVRGPGSISLRRNPPLRLIVLSALAFRLILFFSEPIQEIDYYRYLWDGRVGLEGVSPYRHAPLQIDWAPHAAPGSEAHRLWELSRQSPALATLFTRIHHREVPTVYPPASQVVFTLAAGLTPPSAPLRVHLLVLKGLLLLFDVGTLFLLIALLRRLGLPPAWCLAYAWCPLVLKEFANSAHLDSIAVFFTVLALYCLIRAHACPVPSFRNWATAGLAALGVGVLAKSYPVVLLPVAAAYLFARTGSRALVPLGACGLVIALGYLPFWTSQKAQPAPSAAFAPQPGQPSPEGHDPLAGLRTFLGRWQMNDLVFMVVHENLREPTEGPDHWFVVVPRTWREGVDDSVRGLPASFRPPEGFDPAFLLTQGLLGLVFAGLVLWWARGVWREPQPGILLRACFLVLVWGWLLGSAQNPWYLLWALPFMIFEGRLSWFLLPGLALLYYLRFHLEYQALASAEEAARARAFFDFGVVWWEFLPFYAALLLETLWRTWKRTPSAQGQPSVSFEGRPR